jgi:ribosomal protein L7/L12
VEAAELAKLPEMTWGVSAAATVVYRKPVNNENEGQKPPPQSEFAVILKSAGEKKINVIKEVRYHRPWSEGSQGSGGGRRQDREGGHHQGRS